jgi:hypothetical protein
MRLGDCSPGSRWSGRCHDCGCDVTVRLGDDVLDVAGGAVYSCNGSVKLKCDACFREDPVLRNFQECEVYSRVVGYLRPTKQWNDGKRAEFNDRLTFGTSLFG